MKTFKEKGYLWKCYGFSNTHMWGLHLTSGFLAIVSVGMLTFTILNMGVLNDKLFYKLIASSVAITIINISMILYSIFTIMFYKNAKLYSSLKDKIKTELKSEN